jgi:hypothetical protein
MVVGKGWKIWKMMFISAELLAVLFIILINSFCAISCMSTVLYVKDYLTKGKRLFDMFGKYVWMLFFQMKHMHLSFQGVSFHSDLYLFCSPKGKQQILPYKSMLERNIHFILQS